MALVLGTSILDSQRPDHKAREPLPVGYRGWVPKAVRGRDVATQLPSALLQVACHLLGPPVGYEDGIPQDPNGL